jgi:hypothetical protein
LLLLLLPLRILPEADAGLLLLLLLPCCRCMTCTLLLALPCAAAHKLLVLDLKLLASVPLSSSP